MFSRAYKRYVLGALTLAFALSVVDRALMALLLQPIKEELHLSDTQLGFVTGIAFALFYATLGLPIARWADRGNRTTIASVALALWSCTVMLCVFVGSFSQLVLVRIAAAVGESGGMPPTYSLVGDYFQGPAERTRAMATYWLANPLAALLSFIVGGWLNERFGWRITFFLIGAPGLLVALLVRWSVIEPRTRRNGAQIADRQPPRMVAVLSSLWTQRSSRHLAVAIILLFTLGFGLAPWHAAFMMRSHGMGTAELGVWLGFIIGMSGIAGIALGGYVTARWYPENPAQQMRLSALMIALVLPSFVLFLFAPGKHQALLALIPVVLVFNFFFGPAFALLQRLVADEVRATTLAVVMLLANLIGMGIGPQVVGTLSDFLLPVLGSDSLRYAMLAMSCVALWAAYHFWETGRTIEEDLSKIPARLMDERPDRFPIR